MKNTMNQRQLSVRQSILPDDTTKLDDRQCLQDIAMGDQQAFERLFKHYHPRIYKFAIRLLHDPQLAEEVTCDTLYAVWQSASKFLGRSTVSTWILGIAYRRAMKSYNKQARFTNKIEPDADLATVKDNNPQGNPENYTNSMMQSNLINAALEALNKDQRAVIELTALGHSCAEIAEIIQCPENTVKTRAYHARHKMRSYLEGIAV